MSTITGFLKDNEGIYIPKDTEAVLTYSIDWTNWLTNSDTIVSSVYAVETITGDADPLLITAQSSTDTQTTVKLSGGSTGNIYKVYNTITTSGSQTERRYFRIRVETRSL